MFGYTPDSKEAREAKEADDKARAEKRTEAAAKVVIRGEAKDPSIMSNKTIKK